MDPFASSQIMSFCGNYYALVVVDDFSPYTWKHFISNIKKAFVTFLKLTKVIQKEKNLNISSI